MTACAATEHAADITPVWGACGVNADQMMVLQDLANGQSQESITVRHDDVNSICTNLRNMEDWITTIAFKNGSKTWDAVSEPRAGRHRLPYAVDDKQWCGGRLNTWRCMIAMRRTWLW